MLAVATLSPHFETAIVWAHLRDFLSAYVADVKAAFIRRIQRAVRLALDRLSFKTRRFIIMRAALLIQRIYRHIRSARAARRITRAAKGRSARRQFLRGAVRTVEAAERVLSSRVIARVLGRGLIDVLASRYFCQQSKAVRIAMRAIKRHEAKRDFFAAIDGARMAVATRIAAIAATERDELVARIQCTYRRKKARRRLFSARRYAPGMKICYFLMMLVVARKGRDLLVALAAQRRQDSSQAVACAWKGHIARQVVGRMMALKKRRDGASDLGRAMLCHLARRRNKRLQVVGSWKARTNAMRGVQAAVRRRQLQGLYSALLMRRILRERKRAAMAVKIQCAFRAYSAFNKIYNKLWEANEAIAARMVQGLMRSYKAKALLFIRRVKQRMRAAQCLGFHFAWSSESRAAILQKVKEVKAASMAVLSRSWRVALARRKFREIQQCRREREAAHVLRRCGRVFLSKLRYFQMYVRRAQIQQ